MRGTHTIDGLVSMPYDHSMKMTMHIDDTLLARAMEIAGVESKTGAVDIALREFVRRGHLAQVLAAGLNKSPDELAEVFHPAYDLDALRLSDTPPPHGHKSRPRR